MSVKQDTTRPYVLRPSSPIVVKLTWLAAFLFTLAGGMFATYRLGYEAAWRKTESVYNDAILLKAQATELEAKISQLKNYAVLIDALALQGKGAHSLQHDVMMIPDTVICTVQVSQSEAVND